MTFLIFITTIFFLLFKGEKKGLHTFKVQDEAHVKERQKNGFGSYFIVLLVLQNHFKERTEYERIQRSINLTFFPLILLLTTSNDNGASLIHIYLVYTSLMVPNKTSCIIKIIQAK